MPMIRDLDEKQRLQNSAEIRVDFIALALAVYLRCSHRLTDEAAGNDSTSRRPINIACEQAEELETIVKKFGFLDGSGKIECRTR
jgi:hypothetical protein